MDGGVVVISFSGPEGSGKTTLQKAITDAARDLGLNVRAMHAMECSLSTRLRDLTAAFGRKKAKRRYEIETGSRTDPGMRRPARPKLRTARRIVTYVVDAMLMRLTLQRLKRSGVDVVVFDRHLYDAFVKVVDHAPKMVRRLHAIMPRPDLAFLITPDPDACLERRPGADRRYYAVRSRQFQEVAQLCPELICTDSTATTRERVLARVLPVLREIRRPEDIHPSDASVAGVSRR